MEHQGISFDQNPSFARVLLTNWPTVQCNGWAKFNLDFRYLISIKSTMFECILAPLRENQYFHPMFTVAYLRGPYIYTLHEISFNTYWESIFLIRNMSQKRYFENRLKSKFYKMAQQQQQVNLLEENLCISTLQSIPRWIRLAEIVTP